MRGDVMGMRAAARRTGTTRTRRAVACSALAVLSAVALVGCGGSDEASAGSSDGDRPSESRSAPDPSTSPSADRTASAQPSVSAADGHDAAACSDGNCEIAVSEPVTIRFDGPAGSTILSVTEVGPDRIEYALKSGNGQSEGGAEGHGQGCLTVLRSNGSGTSCGGMGDGRPPSAQSDAVVIQAATGEDGTALLHIVSG
ncbi:hypothetical protein WJ438_36580 [Streptomyces sp. GD-15H]|uniref:hypothetical protein n=1 Tax=Streptomyces sp. GD-15H TaxID=3129112 RepID=UPI003248D50C